ncbi:hypothetical protein RND71_032158 [Anisodus tanguticus]|uniref:Uncharacterized protein n=1 Tax=Anisodus tanguticus TaxID=243964 RepID=A0AAE1UY47_9SOLA|nr:hypothetical protein RND71_032158 [Anisodus tanguticus]
MQDRLHGAPIITHGLQDFSDCIITTTKGRSYKAQLHKLLYAEFIHTLWLERNNRIFEKRESSVEALVPDSKSRNRSMSGSVPVPANRDRVPESGTYHFVDTTQAQSK